ncbi:sll0787 family AIR synthase-like protein [Gluconacetobacter azotocaptans]|uniref:Sll0787 family AIR synthase-like protein n=1 Tax=Gluconacetobacter azotocaptans TaxID=142834 RepID=A0A7W4PC98_9PROT|nr:sll0787 family AIR synthase-like protein [Gluconacetobacter azotocaptans]MBB2188503.1 sll0787 family AIR synthase-like protein [Gluconacetobacter azotocaptans]GBQ28019.1 selenophosphate synthetase [Gluconacetobacter azotocaptans DSM 13594]
MTVPDLTALARQIRQGRALAAKHDIAGVVARLGLPAEGLPRLGDDCAAIPDGDGFLLFATEGFQDEFVRSMPWFAGYCGIMVNAGDVAAMGGRPIAVVDALWSRDGDQAAPILHGLACGARTYGIPVLGGHTNLRAGQQALSVAILGRARRLLTSFDAYPGEALVAAIDLRGRWHDPHPFWDASSALCDTEAAGRLRGDLDILPGIAEDGLSRAAKDISMAGLVGTALMLAECSRIAITIDLGAIPAPSGVDMGRWLAAFPSYGFLLTARPDDVPAILARFAARGIAASAIGACQDGTRVDVIRDGARETVWDLARAPLMGCAP